MAQEEIKLVGVFKDEITPKLKKLNKEIDAVTKSFEKLGRRLRPIAREFGRLAASVDRVGEGMARQNTAMKDATVSMSRYRTQVRRTAAEQKKLKPMRGGGGNGGGGGGVGGGRGRGGGGAGMVAAGVIGERMMDKNMGFGKTLLAMTGAGLAVNAVTGAFSSMTNASKGFIMAGSQAEQGVIQMAGTLQTLGKIGDFGKSKELAKGMMTELADIAAALPGATNDYLTILQQTLDDQITAFGSADKVTENLKKGEQSFTALFGMSAQLAGLRPQVAAMDINQLRTNPTNMRNVQLLTRNPTLQKFYKEELKKTGGDFFMALKNAMEKAITPEQIAALKRSFDSAYQTFLTGFTDPYSGVLGTMRQLEVSINGVMQEGVTVMDQAGATMFALNEIFERIWSLVGGGQFDPMVMLFKALYSLEYMFGFIAGTIDRFVEDGLNFGEMVYEVGEVIGNLLAAAANWVLNLDYNQFFKYVDDFIYNLFQGIIEGFSKAFKGGAGPFEAFGNSVSGTIASLIALKLAADAAAFSQAKLAAGMGFGRGGLRGLKGIQGPMPTAAGTAGLMKGGATAGLISKAGLALKNLIPLLSKLAVVLTAMIAIAGGTDEAMEQGGGFLSEIFFSLKGSIGGVIDVFSELTKFTVDLVKTVIDLINGIFNLIPGVDNTAGSFQILQLLLVPITATFQLIEMGLKGLVEGLANVRLFLLRATSFGRNDAEIEQAEADVKRATTEQSKSKKRIDVSNTAMRYGGAANYAKVLEQDIASKKAAHEQVSASSAAYKKLNEEIYALSKTLKEAQRQGGVKASSSESQNKGTVASLQMLSAAGTTPEAAKALESIPEKIKEQTAVTVKESEKTRAEAKTVGTEIKTSVDSAKTGIESKLSALAGISPKLDSILSELQSGLNVKMTGMVPGAMGGAQGGPAAFGDLAAMSGLIMTSGYRPGDEDSYHGINRARDYAGSGGDMMMFANMMAGMYGGSLKELIYTPMGFSIKNGQRVPPYAQDTHYDHVHVAYGRGAGNPAFFGSQSEAVAWEKKVAPKNTAVQSVTSNSGEMGGGNTFNINVTGGGSAQETAEIVAQEIVYAIQKSTYNELYTS